MHCNTGGDTPPELIDGEEEYEIEEIIDQHTDKWRWKKQYLVSWVGYPASENSWVNESDLHAPELLEEYHLSKAWPLEYIRPRYFHSEHDQKTQKASSLNFLTS